MHGVIFASFRDYLEARRGTERTERILVGEPAYSVVEAYADERFDELVTRAHDEDGTPLPELLRDFGAFTAEHTFARLFPAQFTAAGDTRTFLLGVETHIHELVRATIPNAQPPRLAVSARDGGVAIEYSSARRLCSLLVGLVEGTAACFREQVEIEETACRERGDPVCVFAVAIRRA